jgi:YjbE family integral membrane protein
LLDEILHGTVLAQIAGIVVIDLVLSGDNAVVIGMAANQLPPHQRRRAILFGAGAAIGLRVLFTALVALLLSIPLLQLLGGAMLTWIAVKLMRPHSDTHEVQSVGNQWEAIRTIVMADVVMSLDNILAVGGAAHGSLWLLLFGLGLSMPLITVGSGVVAWAMDRLPMLVYLGAGVLAWTAAMMMIHDPYAHGLLGQLGSVEVAVPPVVTVLVLAIGFLWRRRLTVAAA